MSVVGKPFPILRSGQQVPWDFVAPYERQALINHSQTLARLAERGGLDWCELFYVLNEEQFPFGNSISNKDACAEVLKRLREWEARQAPEPIPMVLHCPHCHVQHIDAPEPETGWTNPPHKSHQCHGCGAIWRPASVPTTGVESVPAGKNDRGPQA